MSPRLNLSLSPYKPDIILRALTYGLNIYSNPYPGYFVGEDTEVQTGCLVLTCPAAVAQPVV